MPTEQIHGGQEIRDFLKSPHIGSTGIDVTGIAVGAIGPQGPQGLPGADGRTVRNGTTNPSNDLGVNGDFYINTTAWTIFGPKTAGAWGVGVSIIGPAGSGGGGGGGGFTTEEVQDIVGAMFGHLGHTNLVATYNDAGNLVELDVSLEDVQDIVAAMLTGNAGVTYNDTFGTITLPAGGGSSSLDTAFPVTLAKGITLETVAPPAGSTSTPVGYLRAPWAFTLTEVRAFQLTPDGATATVVDVHLGALGSDVTILGNKITIPAAQRSSEVAGVQPTIVTSAVPDDGELWFYLDSRGDASRGVVVWLLGVRNVTGVPATAPGAPTSLTVTAGNAQNVLAWTAPTSTGTVAGGGTATISAYVIEWGTDGVTFGNTINDDATTGFTHTGLTNGTTYHYRVRARNNASLTGAASASASGAPAAPGGSGTARSIAPTLSNSGRIVWSSEVGGFGHTYAQAQALNTSVGVGTLTLILGTTTPAGGVGQGVDSVFEADPAFYVNQQFLEFNTAVGGTVAASPAPGITLQLTSDLSTTDFLVEAFLFDYGTLADTDMRTGPQVAALTKVAELASSGIGSAGLKTMTITNQAALNAAINTAGTTRILLASNRYRTNTAPAVDVMEQLNFNMSGARLEFTS
jgi:hypothetical protein